MAARIFIVYTLHFCTLTHCLPSFSVRKCKSARCSRCARTKFTIRPVVGLLQKGIRLAAQLLQSIIDRPRAPRQLDPLPRNNRITGREGIAQQRQPGLFRLADIACDQLLNPPVGFLIIADHPNGRLHGFEVNALHRFRSLPISTHGRPARAGRHCH